MAPAMNRMKVRALVLDVANVVDVLAATPAMASVKVIKNLDSFI